MARLPIPGSDNETWGTVLNDYLSQSLDSGGAIKSDALGVVPLAFNTQTGTTYTLVLADAGKVVGMNNAAANTLRIPTNASVAFPIGTNIALRQVGAGQTTVNAVTPGTTSLVSRGSAFKLAGQYAYASLIKVGTDAWELSGDIAV